MRRQPVGWFSDSHHLTVTFTDRRCKKGNKRKAEAGPHMNPVKSAMKPLQHESRSHPVPNHHAVAVKDAQYSWQRLIKADFGWSLMKSKGLRCRDERPPVTARWASHSHTERIMHRCPERSAVGRSTYGFGLTSNRSAILFYLIVSHTLLWSCFIWQNPYLSFRGVCGDLPGMFWKGFNMYFTAGVSRDGERADGCLSLF